MAPTQFIDAKNERYAYRRFGKVSEHPLLLLQHFTGTLDNWDPAVTDQLSLDRELILFDNAGNGRSTGTVPLRTLRGLHTNGRVLEHLKVLFGYVGKLVER
jgi:pimeloyl-ACP methyl ester carboxylesterase